VPSDQIDYTHRDGPALREEMLRIARERVPAWSQSPNDVGVALVDAFAHLGDLVLYYMDRIANESYPSTAVEPRSMVQLLRLVGYELEPSKPASVDLQLLFADDARGLRTIPTGAEFRSTRESAGRVVRFRYMGPDLEIDLGTDASLRPEVTEITIGARRFRRWGAPPSLGRARITAGLPVVQIDALVEREVIGSSDASPAQRFSLAQTPVLDDSIRVYVREGELDVEWQRVPTLLYSEPGDRHYMVRRDEAQRVFIELGNATYGMVPPRGVDNLRASYHVGGGSHGNLPADTIVALGERTSTIADLRRTGHEAHASGGTDREALDVAATRAADQFRAQNRAVTARDYEAEAIRFGAAKAKAHSRAWNRVEMYVAPAGGGLPSATFKESLRHHLDSRRVLTTVVDVRDPIYVELEIAGQLIIEPTFFRDQVRQAASDAVADLFAFERAQFGSTLFISKIYEAVEAVPGVRGLTVELLRPRDRAGVPDLPEGGRIAFSPFEIPVTGGMDWRKVTGGQGGV
jgi:hypothetical protein